MLESEITRQIHALLKRRGAWYMKIVAHPRQKTGVPDTLACYRGLFVAIESKQPGCYPSKIQRAVLEDVVNAGGIATVARSVEDVMVLLDAVDAVMNTAKRLDTPRPVT